MSEANGNKAQVRWQELLVLALLCLAIYLPALNYRLTYFDDYILIAQAMKFRGGLQGLGSVFTSDVFGAETVAYRPWLSLSMLADAALAGPAPWIFHLTNVIIHLVASLILCLLLAELGAGLRLSWILAAFFAVHPALVSAVAWIPGRNDSLLGLSLVIGLFSLIKFFKGGSLVWVMAHILSLGAAFFTKESAVAFPLFLLFFFRTDGNAGRGRIAAVVAGWLVGLALWLYLWYGAVGSNPDAGSMSCNGWLENIQGLSGYMGKMFFPLKLAVIPAPEPWMLITGSAVLGLIALAAARWGLDDGRVFIAGCLLVALSLAPHLLRGASFPNFLEHRLYVPLIGLVIALSQLRVWRVVRMEKISPWALGLIGLYALTGALRLPLYQDHLSLWHNVIEKRPSLGLSYQNLGYVFTVSGEYGKAEIYYRRALQLDPTGLEAYNGLGVAYESQERWAEAEDTFKRGLALHPRSAITRYNLAWLYRSRGRLVEAEREYRMSISCRPGYLPSVLNLGMLYHQQGKLEQAGSQYRRALSLDRNLPEALFNLGLLHGQQGRADSASYYLARAFKIKPELKRSLAR